MPRAPGLLHRFLPAGAPGPASVAGVPTDRMADAAAELSALFARLVATEARCDEVLEQGRRDAASTADRAAAQVHSITATAQERAVSERAEAMALAQRAIQEHNDAELRAAHEQAARLRAQAADRVPDYVAAVTAAILDMLSGVRPVDAA